MRITRLTIRNYAGIASADIAIPPAGIVIKGGNARGKTSILRGLRAALLAQGLDPSCIHQGADKSEILVDMEVLHARRTIRQGGKDLVVTGPGGDIKPKPQTILNELFGKEVDPLAFYLADDKERRRMIYQVMPMEVTGEDVHRWTGEPMLGNPFIGHGLEVLAGIRQRYYDKRTAANAAAEESGRRADELRAKADAMGSPSSAVSEGEAVQLLGTVQRELNELTWLRAAHEQARAKAGPTREKIERLRADADGEQKLPVQIGGVEDVDADSVDELETFKRRLREAFDLADVAIASVKRRRQYLDQVTELEESLAGIDSMAVPQEELDAASKRVQDAAAALAQARQAEDYRAARAAADEARVRAVKDLDEAGHLDQVVRTLTTDAPRELAARSKAIPGLDVSQKITLDGVAIDDLSGKEQLEFAVALAKRVRGEGRVLTVDGMEKLDEDELPGFLKMAVAGGWQVIGTRVTRGELQIEAISEEEPS
jgi:hypothetical protein